MGIKWMKWGNRKEKIDKMETKLQKSLNILCNSEMNEYDTRRVIMIQAELCRDIQRI